MDNPNSVHVRKIQTTRRLRLAEEQYAVHRRCCSSMADVRRRRSLSSFFHFKVHEIIESVNEEQGFRVKRWFKPTLSEDGVTTELSSYHVDYHGIICAELRRTLTSMKDKKISEESRRTGWRAMVSPNKTGLLRVLIWTQFNWQVTDHRDPRRSGFWRLGKDTGGIHHQLEHFHPKSRSDV